MYLVSLYVLVQRDEIVNDKLVERYAPAFSVLAFLPVFLMAVFNRPYSDTILYLSSYRALPGTLHEAWNEIAVSDRPGFLIFGVLIKTLFKSNEVPYRAAIGLVHSLPVVFVLRKYADDYLFSLFLFIASGMHVAWMMNGLRQFMAVTLIFATTPWMLEKKYVRIILVILLAASFHRTALIMIPIVFIAQGKTWNWKTIVFSIVLIGASFLFSRNASLFNDFANVTGYSTEFAIQLGDDGTNPLRVIVNSIPAILALLSRDALEEEDNKTINICVNMSVITAGIYLLSMVTSGVLTGRLPIYTSLYNLILLPHVIDSYFVDNNATVVKLLTIALYFAYFAVQWQL